MSEYQLLENPDLIRRLNPRSDIPNSPANSDWLEYQAWLVGGGIPLPVGEPSLPEVKSIEIQLNDSFAYQVVLARFKTPGKESAYSKYERDVVQWERDGEPDPVVKGVYRWGDARAEELNTPERPVTTPMALIEIRGQLAITDDAEEEIERTVTRGKAAIGGANNVTEARSLGEATRAELDGIAP